MFNSWQNAVSGSWNQVWFSVLLVLPKIVGAILVFAFGLILAHWVKKLIQKGLNLLRFEKLTEKAGLDGYLQKAGVKFTFTELLATFFEWILILVFFLAGTEVLGLTVVSSVIAGVLGYIPNILAAALIFALGFVFAKVVDGIVRGSIAGIDKDIAKPAGLLAKWIVILSAFFAAIGQLQVAQGLVSVFFQGLTYTLVLVIGLSVGLGAKDLVSRVLNDWYDKAKK
ncbi:MAG: hypothetical protein Q8Q30_00355 [Candidatus Woesebacteria bacterium]|nr:hypothetical protein [Candidatus Woesebacteria bacterium]